jgi:hypothetical protein
MTDKVYKVLKVDQRGKELTIEGTLDYLKQYFSYTLLIGNQENPKIKKDPKNIKEFMTALQKSYSAKEAACVGRTFVDLI